jgi:hypothetical protein
VQIMTSHLDRRAVVLAALFAVPAGVALAQGGPPFGRGQGGPPDWGGQGGPPGWGQGGPPGWGGRRGPPDGAFSGPPVDRTKVEAAVKTSLGKATKGKKWTSPRGVEMMPIVVDNEIVGQLWENVDPKTLTIGAVWPGPEGVRVELARDGKVIGMLWVKVS